ncbi:unnamed protein product [Cercospora beticola]|nr:unnamed protein product [Cercospora beticola]
MRRPLNIPEIPRTNPTRAGSHRAFLTALPPNGFPSHGFPRYLRFDAPAQHLIDTSIFSNHKGNDSGDDDESASSNIESFGQMCSASPSTSDLRNRGSVPIAVIYLFRSKPTWSTKVPQSSRVFERPVSPSLPAPLAALDLPNGRWDHG